MWNGIARGARNRKNTAIKNGNVLEALKEESIEKFAKEQREKAKSN